MYQLEVITDLATEPVTLQEAKDFMTIDFTDFDDLITMLITSSREESEKATGLAYGAKLIQITGNTYTDRTGVVTKIYPITPFVSDETWVDEDGNIDYQYNAGYTVIPTTLKVAILARVATDFAYRQGNTSDPMLKVWSAYIAKEAKYRNLLAV